MDFDHLEEKEAVKKAALIEENGYKFYSIMTDRSEDAETKAIFARLAADEVKHKKVIENRYFEEAGFGMHITEEELMLEDYLTRTHAGEIFTKRIDVEKLADMLDHPRKALDLALSTEKYSVSLFEGLAKNAKTEEGRQMYLNIAQEEKAHVELIESLLKVAPPL